MSDLLQLIKQAAVEAVDAKQPVALRYGTVISISPLQIRVDQKLVLDAEDIVLTKHLTDYAGTSNVVIDGVTQTITVTVSNSLTVGDTVVMLREQGGQRYIVMDRTVIT